MHYFFMIFILFLFVFYFFRKNSFKNENVVEESIIVSNAPVIVSVEKDERTIQLEKLDSYLKGILIAKQQKEDDLILLKQLSEKYPKEALEYLNLPIGWGSPTAY